MEKYHRNLLILVISAKDLERVIPFERIEVYEIVSISGGGKKRTAVDTVKEETAANQILVVDLRCCAPTVGCSDKAIGEVLVQGKDLMGSIEYNSLTYQI
ncbi:hypothetical protein ACSBR2_013529 [Camellia fascicularis]